MLARMPMSLPIWKEQWGICQASKHTPSALKADHTREKAFFHFSRQGYLITPSQMKPQCPECLSQLPMALLIIPKVPRSQRATSLAAQGTPGSWLWRFSCSSAQITAIHQHDPATQLPSLPSNTAALAEKHGQQEEEQNLRQDLPWVAQLQNKLQGQAETKGDCFRSTW